MKRALFAALLLLALGCGTEEAPDEQAPQQEPTANIGFTPEDPAPAKDQNSTEVPCQEPEDPATQADCTACDDGNPCTVDTCVGDNDCAYSAQPLGTLCDDEDPCTLYDQCNGMGKCVAKTPMNCNDGDPCTTDSCKGGLCVSTDNGTCEPEPKVCPEPEPCPVCEEPEPCMEPEPETCPDPEIGWMDGVPSWATPYPALCNLFPNTSSGWTITWEMEHKVQLVAKSKDAPKAVDLAFQAGPCFIKGLPTSIPAFWPVTWALPSGAFVTFDGNLEGTAQDQPFKVSKGPGVSITGAWFDKDGKTQGGDPDLFSFSVWNNDITPGDQCLTACVVDVPNILAHDVEGNQLKVEMWRVNDHVYFVTSEMDD